MRLFAMGNRAIAIIDRCSLPCPTTGQPFSRHCRACDRRASRNHYLDKGIEIKGLQATLLNLAHHIRKLPPNQPCRQHCQR